MNPQPLKETTMKTIERIVAGTLLGLAAVNLVRDRSIIAQQKHSLSKAADLNNYLTSTIIREDVPFTTFDEIALTTILSN